MTEHDWKAKSNLTWKDVESCVSILSDKLKKNGFEFDMIATVSRGGLVPARLIADHFNIKKIIVDKKVIPKRTLFVDDIYDSGITFKRIIQIVKYPEDFVYATLIMREGINPPKQLIYAKKTRGKEYIVFPWDRLESKRTDEHD